MNDTPEPNQCSTGYAALRLGISPRTAKTWADTGRLPVTGRFQLRDSVIVSLDRVVVDRMADLQDEARRIGAGA